MILGTLAEASERSKAESKIQAAPRAAFAFLLPDILIPENLSP
jgi:hypothetical protein